MDQERRCLCNNACTGCMLCKAICPTQAIKVAERNGYLYPTIDSNLCVKCGMCDRCCPQINADVLKLGKLQDIYVAKNKDDKERDKSTSGGMYILFAKFVIERGGVIYGAGYTTDMYVKHMRATNLEEAKKFQGSKYVQSDMAEVYPLLEKDLRNKTLVLFTGTPCQIAAVQEFIIRKRLPSDQMITVEILCYGVPSPKVFSDHMRFLNDSSKRVVDYKFRDKRDGWSNQYIHSAQFSNGEEIYRDIRLQGFEKLFWYHYSVRESCFHCKYNSEERCADITIGDCWGVDRIVPEITDNKGVSQVKVNTERGKTVWDQIKRGTEFRSTEFKTICLYNSVYRNPPQRPIDYDSFWRFYNKRGYIAALRKYTPYGGVRYKVYRKLVGVWRRVSPNNRVE